MSLFNSAESAALEAEILDELTDQCKVWQVSETKDSNGVHKTRTQRGATTVCAYGVMSGRELERAQRVAAEAELVVTLPKGTVVQGNDVLEITDAVTSEVIEVQVVWIGRHTRRLWLDVFAKNLKA